MKRKNLSWLIVMTVILLVIVVGGIGYLSFKNSTSLLPESSPQTASVQTMGTTVTITNYTKNISDSTLQGALQIAKDYNTWTTVSQSGSIVDEINRESGLKPVKVSDQVFQLIQDAYDLSDQGTGYDVTVGPLTQLWHIGFPDAKLPTQDEINAVLPLINYKFIQLDATNKTVYLTQRGAQLDLGSITKGYVCKLMTAYLRTHGMTDGIIDLGSSSIYVMGHSPRGDNIAWNVGIKDPNHPEDENIGIVTAENQYISTSGIYERYLKVGNTVYPHILNPQTGYPFANDIQSVTVVGTDSPTFGDGVTTTIFALGTKKGYEYCVKHGYAAAFVDKNNKIYLTPNMKKIFTVNSASKYKVADISSLNGEG